MESTISNLIFPRPSPPSYGLDSAKDAADAMLVHIRRRQTKKFTFGFYVSPTLRHLREQQQQRQQQQQRRPDGHGYAAGASAASPSPLPSTNPPPSPPSPPSRYLVLYGHPNAADIGHMLYDARALSQSANVDVLVWEFRGYGLCDGAASERELYLDMEAVYDFAENQLGVPSHQIILMGRSIGSGPSSTRGAAVALGS